MSDFTFHGVKPTGKLGDTAEAQVREMIEVKAAEIIPTREQIFTAIGAALHVGEVEPASSHEYGMPVVWIDTSIQRQRGAWVPKAPVFSQGNNTYIIPRDEGVAYSVGGKPVDPGVYTVVPPATVSVTAAALPGYTLAGRTSWEVEFEERLTAYDQLALDAAPEFYWRMDDPEGSTGLPRNRGRVDTPNFNTRIQPGTFAKPGVGLGDTAFYANVSATQFILADERPFTDFTVSAVTIFNLRSPRVSLISTWDESTIIRVEPDPHGNPNINFFGKIFGETFTHTAHAQDQLIGRPVQVGATCTGGILSIYLGGAKIFEKSGITGKHALTHGIRITHSNHSPNPAPFGGVIFDRTKALSEQQMAALGKAVGA